MFNPTLEVIVAQARVRPPLEVTFEGVLKRFPGLAEAEAVCLTGSIAAGWGNVNSDFDVYAFSDKPLDLPVDETSECWPGVDQSGVRWDNWMGEFQESRVDLTIWTPDTLTTVLKPYLDGEVEFCGMSYALRDFVYRFSIGIPLKNEDYFRQMRELLTASSFARARARWSKAATENSLTDVAGQLDAGDGASARLSAVRAAAGAAEACLLLQGDLCPTEKWLMRRLERKPECGITADEYRSVVLDGARPGESDADFALRVARWAQGHIVRLEPEFMTVS
ncbi:hypothetical protein AB0K27_05450 [Micromonospora echinospora]|uniref:hypothetical protein n=1 Tax=Micromonospora echinospora TaxID=1877 RepID=UPI003415D0C1